MKGDLRVIAGLFQNYANDDSTTKPVYSQLQIHLRGFSSLLHVV